MKKITGLLAMVGVLAAGAGANAAIDGTPHDISGATYTLCEVCHVPHGAAGAERLWRTAYTLSGTGWDLTITGGLCGDACHGASPAISTNAHNVSGSVYGSGAHQGTIATLNTLSSGRDSSGSSPYTDAHGYKYWPAGGQVSGFMECTTCHNVHDDTVRPFIRQSASSPASPAGSIDALCEGCHDRDNVAPLLGTANTLTANNGSAYSQHPTNVALDGATSYDPDINIAAAIPALMGTDRGTPSKGNISAANPLGGKLLGADGTTGNIGCATCHAVHGTSAGVITTDLLAIGNALPVADLCEACHGGGSGAGTPAGVGGNVGAGGDDHPIDAVRGTGTPLANIVGTTAYETGALWPTTGTSPNQIAGCTSCHSAHYGLPTTALNRTGGNAIWCNSCHTLTDAQPNAHHSNVFNHGLSIVGCEDCHVAPGVAGEMNAHQGFAEIPWATSQAAFCGECHGGAGTAPFNGGRPTPAGGTNPTDIYSATVGRLPMRFGVDRSADGADSSAHVVGAAPSATNSNMRTASWFTEGTTSYYSKWGGDTDSAGYGAQTIAPTPANGDTVLCYGCHNIMGNAGLSTNPLINVGNAGVVDKVSGWKNNLTLFPFQDDGQGTKDGTLGSATGSLLCFGCHGAIAKAMNAIVPVTDGPAGTHPIRYSAMAGFYAAASSTVTGAVDAGRAITMLVTTAGDGTYADQTSAPNLASYANVDRMDCDSCHRAHDGDADASITSPANHDYTLEQASTGNLDAICSQCHKVYGAASAQ